MKWVWLLHLLTTPTNQPVTRQYQSQPEMRIRQGRRVDLQDARILIPILPETGVPIPIPRDARISVPILRDAGILIPVLPDAGVLIPVLPDAGVLIPVLPDAGVPIPVLPGAGVPIPVLPNAEVPITENLVPDPDHGNVGTGDLVPLAVEREREEGELYKECVRESVSLSLLQPQPK